MPVSRFKLDAPLRHLVGAGAMLALTGGTVLVFAWAFADTLSQNSNEIQAAEFSATISPSSPYVRYRYATLLERTFDLGSIARSLAEYEAAVAASPYNFSYWIGLGQARERDGDRPGAELAYRRALKLAPNYARTHWALGNNLIRQGKIDEGVALIRRAVDQDAIFAAPAVTATMQAFDGDVPRASAALGANPAALAELSKYLVNESRFDEGLAVWRSANLDTSIAAVRDAGIAIRGKLIEVKRFRDAVQISTSLEPDADRRSALGAITNGGFETGVVTQNVDYFDWQIGQSYPILGLSESQVKEGRYSLIVRFATPSRLDFATVSRTVAVEPGADYDLVAAYRSDLNTRAEFRWEVISAADQRRLAVSDTLQHQTDWTEVKTRVSIPVDTDGITIRLIREKCDSAACTISGNMWFDEFRLVE